MQSFEVAEGEDNPKGFLRKRREGMLYCLTMLENFSGANGTGVDYCLGVPLRVGLSAASPAQSSRTKPSPGFPLLSLTQESHRVLV